MASSFLFSDKCYVFSIKKQVKLNTEYYVKFFQTLHP